MRKERSDIKDLTGKRFGKLVVISKAGSIIKNGRSKVYWTCICDCGVSRDIMGESLVSGNTTACGCVRKENAFRLKAYNKLPDGEASFNSLYKALCIRAGKKQIELQISKEEFKILTKKNCYYCGVPPQQSHSNRIGSTQYVYNGLDRIDNSLGYTLNNVVPCCGRCNRMKGILTQDFFIKHVIKIQKYLCSV